MFRLNHAWLPMSRYWILAIGLLGRYGARQDEGKFYVENFRGDLHEERPSATVDSEGSFDYDDGSASENESTDDSGKGGLSSHRRSSDGSSVSSRSASKLPKPDSHIYGKTGRFKRLRRSRESQDITSPLQFFRHNKAESGVYPKIDASLVTLYWLAEGFIPIPGGSNVFCFGNPQVEPPIFETKSSTTISTATSFYFGDPRLEPSISETKSSTTIGTATSFCFKLARSVPHSIRQASTALGTNKSKLYFLQRISPEDDSEEKYMELGNPPESSYRAGTTGAHQLIHGFLSLDWNAWGYLTWQLNTSMWTEIFLRPTSMLENLLPIIWMSPKFQEATQFADFFPQMFRRWRHWDVFNQHKTWDLSLLNCVLETLLRLDYRAKIVLSTLVITDSSFRTWVTAEVVETAMLAPLVRTADGRLLEPTVPEGTLPTPDPETDETLRLQLTQLGSKATITSVCGKRFEIEEYQSLEIEEARA